MKKEITELKTILDNKFISTDAALIESIKKLGVITPLIVSNGIVCDGHRRLKVCRELGIKEVPVTEVSGEPVELFIELNNREFDANTVSILSKNLSDEKIAYLCKKAGFSDSPQMVNSLKILGGILDKKPELFPVKLPANIWREMGHLGSLMEKYSEDLLIMAGTVSEKRNIATFLRQAQRRNELPESIKAQNAADIIPLLQKTAQPRRTEAFAKYEKAVAVISFPKGAALKIDPTFAQPGVILTIPVSGNELDKLDRAKESLAELFKAVPEL